jgi:hypothetical protein
MAIRIIGFICGASFGAVGAMVNFWWQNSELNWGIVGLVALVFGVVSASFGKEFWETATSIWP